MQQPYIESAVAFSASVTNNLCKTPIQTLMKESKITGWKGSILLTKKCLLSTFSYFTVIGV